MITRKLTILLLLLLVLSSCGVPNTDSNFEAFTPDSQNTVMLHKGNPQERQKGQDKLFHAEDTVTDRGLSDGEIPFDANAPDAE